MSRDHYRPKLNKRRVLSHAGFTVWSVNGFAVRNVARPDEEFGNFATRDEFPDLIPEGQVWISEKLAPKEGIFFIANALTRLSRLDAGESGTKAEQAGLEVERLLREKVNGIPFRDGKPHREVPRDIYLEHYATLPDARGEVEVWLIDGNLARSHYKTDYTEGGHGYVYPWVPRQQIWIEDGVDRREVPFIVCHEYLERRLMRDAGLSYDKAHPACSRAEFDLRKREGAAPLLVKGRRRLAKGDLAGLARDDVYDFVRRTYASR